MDSKGADADPAGTPARPAEIVDDVAFEAVAIRRGSRRDGRWRLAAVGVLAAAIVAIGLLGPRSDGRGLFESAARSQSPSASIRPAATPARAGPSPTRPPGTPLPAVAIHDPAAVVGPIPLMGHGYRQTRLILDPGTGAITTLSDEFQAGLWVDDGAGGTLCICRLSPWDPEGERAQVVAVTWDSDGREVSRRLLAEYFAANPVAFEPTPVGPSIALDVALSADRSMAIVGSAIGGADGSIYQVEGFAVATGAVLWSRVLATSRRAAPASIPPSTGAASSSAEPVAQGAIAEVSVRRSPVDDRIVVTVLAGTIAEEIAWHRSSWLITVGAGAGSVTGDDPILFDDEAVPSNVWCGYEGFATAERYVRVCERWSPAGQASTWVQLISAADGALIRDVPISDFGRPFGPALVEVGAGLVYLWDAMGHRIVRLDATSAETATASFGLGSGVGALGRSVTIPEGAGQARWTGLTSSFAWGTRAALVGSRDGSVIYAAGIDAIPEPFRGAIPSSTGIWVFDATTLELLTIIPPAAVHDAVSLTADGRHLLATGIPGLDDQSRPAEWGVSLSVFDARDGHLVLQLGAAAASDDLGISLVWPPRPG